MSGFIGDPARLATLTLDFRPMSHVRPTESSRAAASRPPAARGPWRTEHGRSRPGKHGSFPVSVVIHGDAAATDTTLSSLVEQTVAGWELVVQTGGTPEIEGSQPWLLFLDAGDTLHPAMLARVRQLLASHPTLDAVHCGWTLVDESGDAVLEESCDAEGDLFDLLARRPAFPSCACVVKRTAVAGAGGFDRAMGTAADWVLWQRVARRGARFGRVRDSLVARRASADRDASPAEAAGAALRAIALGHAADPAARVQGNAPHARGRVASADESQVNAVCGAAARALAAGGDATSLIELLPRGRRDVDPDAAAAEIVRTAPLALAQPSTWWGGRWEALRDPLDGFLGALERRIERPGAARSITARMQRLVLTHLATPLPPAAAGTHLGVVDVAAPIEDVFVEASVETAQLLVQLERDVLGAVELTPIEGRISAHAVRAAVAEEWAYRVLAHYLARRPEAGTLSTALWERDNPLLVLLTDVMDQVAAAARGSDDGRRRGKPRTMVVEAGQPLPPFIFGRSNIVAELRVAGRRAGATEVVVGRLGVVSRRALRAALCAASEPALTRIVVRDLVLGAPLAGGPPLHERSARAAGAAPPSRRMQSSARRDG